MALRQAEGGTPVSEICRKMQVTEATFYPWKMKFGGLGVSELRELRQLREDNRRLKGLVTDLSVDKEILVLCRVVPKCDHPSSPAAKALALRRRSRL
jgi:putative transposase